MDKVYVLVERFNHNKHIIEILDTCYTCEAKALFKVNQLNASNTNCNIEYAYLKRNLT